MTHSNEGCENTPFARSGLVQVDGLEDVNATTVLEMRVVSTGARCRVE